MFKQNLLASGIASALLFSLPVQAASITGTVTDSKGNPVAGADVKIEGEKKVVKTDANGRYEIIDMSGKKVHIHVYSPAFLHGDKDLGLVSDAQVVNFTLEPAAVENILVTANALRTSVLESVTPVSVISHEQLATKQAATLGDTLKQVPGVHSTYFSAVSSSPIIRGNDGPRVKIVQNSLDAADVSRIGPDHNVAVGVAGATQIEVLRGPATLQYGSGAIGGVVNVVDNRIPSEVNEGVSGEFNANYSTVNDGTFASGLVNAGSGNWAFHANGYVRETDNTEIPGDAELGVHDEHNHGVIENTDMDVDNLVAGLSYVGKDGYFGFAVEQLNNFYGVPGHMHADEAHDDEHDDEIHTDEIHSDEEHAADGVKLDVDMTRYQVAGEWHSPFAGITNLTFAAGYTDYQHSEIEAGQLGTVFSNEATDVRIAAYHKGIGDWHGVLGLQFNDGSYVAEGEEAYTPTTDSNSYALFVVEQKRINDVTIELGARFERNEYSAGDVDIALAAQHLDADHTDHFHDAQDVEYFLGDYSFNNVSGSVGFNWEYNQGESVAVTVSHSERAPSHQELFSAGQHLATQSYDLGLVYAISDHGWLGESLQDVEQEVSTNLDLTLRKYTGDWGYTASFFYNQSNDYIYQSNTGLIAEAVAHEHGDEAEHDEAEVDDHAEELHDEHDAHGEAATLPIYAFRQSDATLYGFEVEAFYDVSDALRLSGFTDYTRAKLDNEDLPRIPPLRVGVGLDYQANNWNIDVSVTYYDDQDKVAPNETVTDDYVLLDASVQYELNQANVDWVFYLRGENLTDEEARVHTSFLKSLAPLPGRNLTVGVRALF